jgi:hypothetical protein
MDAPSQTFPRSHPLARRHRRNLSVNPSSQVIPGTVAAYAKRLGRPADHDRISRRTTARPLRFTTDDHDRTSRQTVKWTTANTPLRLSRRQHRARLHFEANGLVVLQGRCTELQFQWLQIYKDSLGEHETEKALNTTVSSYNLPLPCTRKSHRQPTAVHQPGSHHSRTLRLVEED